MKRLAWISVALVAGMIATLAPAGATPAATQENVRHIANVPGSTGGHVAVDGNRLYMGNYGTGFSMFDITNPRSPQPIGQYLPGPQSAADPGLRADTVPDATVMNGRHIATLSGTGRAAGTQQTEFLDVTDPASPQLLYRFNGQGGTPSGEAHNGDIVDARGLWLPSGGRSGDMLRVYDLRPLLQTPPAAPTKLSGGNLATLWNASPYKARINNPSAGTPTHVHDLEVYTDYNLLLLPEDWVDQDGDGIADPTYALRDLVFMAASQDYPLTVGAGTAAPNSAVFIVDITDPTQPVVINKIQARAGHRYLHEVQLLEGDPQIMFTSDEDLHNGCDAGGVYSWRLSEDLTEAVYLDSWFVGTGAPAPVCSAHVFSSAGDFVFMGAYNAGLQIIDFSDPTNLRRGGQYIAEGANSWGALYHAGVVYVGDFGARGLDVFEFIPDADGKAFLKIGQPGSTIVGGISEKSAGCDAESPTNEIDGFLVPIPEAMRNESHKVDVYGSAEVPGEFSLWFYNSGCGLMNTTTAGTPGGPIPEGANYVWINMSVGTPQWVYAKIT